MTTCDMTIDTYSAADGSIDVSGKYKQLMQDSLGADSIYTRAKETLNALFDGLAITDIEKANLTASHITQLSISLSSTAMESALTWANLEKKNAYDFAKTKAEIEVLHTEKEKKKHEICLTDETTKKVATENTVTANNSAAEVALKNAQVKQVQAAEYQSLSDSYRKSGIIDIATGTDGVLKGVSSSGTYQGYTDQQIKNAARQLEAYDDSKRNHAANSAATIIGHLLASETLSTANEQDVDRWRKAIDYLNDGAPASAV